jgi:hypothetical protein
LVPGSVVAGRRVALREPGGGLQQPRRPQLFVAFEFLTSFEFGRRPKFKLRKPEFEFRQSKFGRQFVAQFGKQELQLGERQELQLRLDCQ